MKLSGGDGGDGGDGGGVGGVPVVISRLSEEFQELREEVTRLLFLWRREALGEVNIPVGLGGEEGDAKWRDW